MIAIRAWDDDLSCLYYPLNDQSRDVLAKIHKQWTDNGTTIMAPLTFIYSNSNELEIEQYIGYCDRNGQPIYEKDLLSFNMNGHWFVATVAISAITLEIDVLVPQELQGRWMEAFKDTGVSMNDFFTIHAEVFGNYHQHQHLIPERC